MSLLPIYRFTTAETSATELPTILINPATGSKVSLDSIVMILQRHIQKKLVRSIVILLTAQYVDVTTFYILCK